MRRAVLGGAAAPLDDPHGDAGRDQPDEDHDEQRAEFGQRGAVGR